MQARGASYVAAVTIGLAGAGLAVLLTWPGFGLGLIGQAFWQLELLSYDFRLANSVPNTPSEHVVIVTIDEGSIADLGTWPWPRSHHARVIQNLAHADAKLIGVDLVLSTVSSTDATAQATQDQPFDWEPEASANDLALAEAIAQAGNVVLALSMAKSHSQHGEMGAEVSQAEFPYWRFEEAAHGLGVVNMPKDMDGPVRRCWLQRTYQDERWFTMPLRDVAVTEFPWSKSIRDERWRYVHYQPEMFGGEDVGELYDLDNDPWEINNLYYDPAHREKVNEMRHRLLDWMIKTKRVATTHPGIDENGETFRHKVDEDGRVGYARTRLLAEQGMIAYL